MAAAIGTALIQRAAAEAEVFWVWSMWLKRAEGALS
jgi:hypothetical protein